MRTASLPRHEPRRVERGTRPAARPALRRGDARLQVQHDGPAGRDRPASAGPHRRDARAPRRRSAPATTPACARCRSAAPAHAAAGTVHARHLYTVLVDPRDVRRDPRRAAGDAARARRRHQRALPRRAPAAVLPRALRLRAAACSRTPKRSPTRRCRCRCRRRCPTTTWTASSRHSMHVLVLTRRVLFRAPAGPRRGFGHLLRCRSLARASASRRWWRCGHGGHAACGRAPRRRRRHRFGHGDSAPDARAPAGGGRPGRAHAAARWIAAARRLGCPVASVHDLGLGCLDGDW